jgi:hypothetical protein
MIITILFQLELFMKKGLILQRCFIFKMISNPDSNFLRASNYNYLTTIWFHRFEINIYMYVYYKLE